MNKYDYSYNSYAKSVVPYVQLLHQLTLQDTTTFISHAIAIDVNGIHSLHIIGIFTPGQIY